MSGNYYIETYGCQMNEHDSEKMAALLEEMGLTPVESAHNADVIVINTCSIREKSEHKVYSALGRLKAIKKKNPHLVTVVAGCVAQQEKGGMLKRIGHLDVVLGTHRISELPSIVQQVQAKRARVEATALAQDVASLHIFAPCKGPSRVCSYVTIMQGCSNFCAYCVVPHTRGPEQSRPLHHVVEEVRRLVDSGVKEITLLGQNVNAYGNDLRNGTSFVGLLQSLDRIRGLLRIRFTTSHPRDFGDALALAMRDLPSVCEQIHLPMQSGSDHILRAMGRGYTRSEYLEKIHVLREKVPGAAITADFIVGFPGETDEEFRATISALEEVRYDQIFSFKYSPRPGTPARRLPHQVPEEVKVERLARVHALQDAITLDYHRKAEGTEEEVLIEGFREKSGQAHGRTRTNKIVNLEQYPGVAPGDLVRVRIVRGLKHSLLGELAS